MRLRVTGAPQRLDRFLITSWPEPIGRRPLAALLARADLRVNGRPARKSTRVQAGDEVRVALAPPIAPPTPDVALPLLHVGPAVVAIDKPPGMPSTEGPSGAPSVAALLLQRYPEMAGLDSPRSAGLVHRLDTGTSGLLLAARDATTHAALRRAFRAHTVTKHYFAIVRGRLETPRLVEQPLLRHPRSRNRMLPGRPGQRRTWQAVTDVRPLAVGDDATLVALLMRTGVTHQLRAHLAHIGHPVLGDRRYGSAAVPTLDPRLATFVCAPWHFLHAAAVALDVDGVPPRLHTGSPPHWSALLRELGWTLDVPALLQG